MDIIVLFLVAYFPYILLFYLIGAIPFGLILSKIILKQDIRKTGSGNIGATNVLRTGNKRLAALTLLLDASKGAIPALLVIYAFKDLPIDNNHFAHGPHIHFHANITTPTALLAGLFAAIGHCFPIWLKFKGGKGVATALGVLLAAVPYAGLAAVIAWIISAKLTKISSLSALIALGIAPIVTFFIYGSAPAIICALITLLVWIRHKDNIKRLLKGTEPKIGDKKKEHLSESVSTK